MGSSNVLLQIRGGDAVVGIYMNEEQSVVEVFRDMKR